jgi:hypothetical protein
VKWIFPTLFMAMLVSVMFLIVMYTLIALGGIVQLAVSEPFQEGDAAFYGSLVVMCLALLYKIVQQLCRSRGTPCLD